MLKRSMIAAALSVGLVAPALARPVEVVVDLASGRRAISPMLFGRNSFAADFDPVVIRESGLRLIRDSHGNNGTKYNWRQDVSSHPDWYNNVYPQRLHERAQRLSSGTYGDLQVLYGLPVLGFVASADGAQFNFTRNDGWQGPGRPEPSPHDNLDADGDGSKYTIPWTAKDSVDMLDFFFAPAPEGLGLDRDDFRYIHLDNEPEVWSNTHDDVVKEPMTAEAAMARYVAVMREVKSRYPELRVMAPGFTSEWQWWNWNDNFVDGLPWMEYFVRESARASRETGTRLIDLIDFHTYVPGDVTDAQLLQQHRIFYDDTYQSPQANGCKRYPDGSWHEDQRVMRVFGRMEEWLGEHFGPDHGITIAVTEAGPGDRAPMVNALWYASMLGTFADHGVELFTPWEWHDSWWEVLHVFSVLGRETRVETSSSDGEFVSAYASTDAGGGVTVILLNRDPSESRSAGVQLANPTRELSAGKLYTLAELPGGMTFRSGTDNALQASDIESTGPDRWQVELPPYSIVTLRLD